MNKELSIKTSQDINENSLKIERIEKPTLEFFQKYISDFRKPVIITGAINNWKALSLWNADYLNTALGDKKVNVAVSKTKTFQGTIEDGFAKIDEPMKFSEFINLLELNRNSIDIYYYLQQSSIPILFPELVKDIDYPIYCDNKLINNNIVNIWLGSGGNISPLHYDQYDNLLAQVRGRKRIVLFEPKQTAFLYPFPVDSKIYHLSQIDIDRPNLKQFPDFIKSRSCECTLEPGEILFIPTFWWHQVYTLDDEKFPTISVNFWYKPPLLLWFATSSGRRELKANLRNKSLK